MSRPTPPADPRFNPSRARTGVLSVFTPINTVLLLLLLAGATTAAVIQFSPAPPPVKAPVRLGVSPPPELLAAVPRSADMVFEGVTKGSALPLFAEHPPTPGLAPPAPGTRVPVNAMDLFSNKPTSMSSPTKMYKGYVVGFCCNNSAGYNGGWDGLTEAEQDTYVRSFIK